ncbi:histidine phosphatase family protein [Mesobacillus selenatarsenatis]|uniref:Alpha-ribazole-5'-phosphate phosphatase n=1 Tax=Mesobacillus selenatarsenatis (strain DSM 18680 / JCM 14380 / FERM P-15431 / SF-1) TaxID=1321606 RepID=A0A0A8WX18_MESS1|nr:histidine phosphatase family protein [Mesobacillus selenatarsenatis]GAM12205.1 alpha-ribazole-5'-phosphate phosphatase [Mesobacillus selenatarsenatis SF-1]
MDDTVVITLLRHGMTEKNNRQAYLGWTDSPLIPAQVFPEFPVCYNRIYTSDLGRCRETAKTLFPQETPILMPEFRELNFGVWEGQTYEQLKDQPVYQKWLAEPFKVTPPNGESFAVFSHRVEEGWRKLTEEILDLGSKSSALVTHGGVIRYLLARYAAEKKDFWEWRIPYGHGYKLMWDIEALRRGERCISLQEEHLTANQNGSGSNIS